MDWLWIALLPPFLFATSTVIDKFLISKYFKGAFSSLVIFSGFSSLFILPVVYFIHPDVFSISPLFALLVMFVGFLYVLYLFPYFAALSIEETSRVVPIFQTIPVFGALLAFFVLGETLTLQQIIAAALVIGGSIGISIEFDRKKALFKRKVLLLVLLASFLVAVSGVIFKVVAVQTNFWVSLFWEQVGFLVLGMLLLALKKNYRKQLVLILKRNPLKVTFINISNELINTMALITFNFATLLAPLGLVWVLNGFQPVFVLAYGIIFTLFFPWIGKEAISRRAIAQKAFFIAVIICGTALLGYVA